MSSRLFSDELPIAFAVASRSFVALCKWQSPEAVPTSPFATVAPANTGRMEVTRLDEKVAI